MLEGVLTRAALATPPRAATMAPSHRPWAAPRGGRLTRPEESIRCRFYTTTRCAGAAAPAPTIRIGEGAAHYPPDLSIEPTHLDIDLRVDVDAQAIEGTVTHTLKVRSGGRMCVGAARRRSRGRRGARPRGSRGRVAPRRRGPLADMARGLKPWHTASGRHRLRGDRPARGALTSVARPSITPAPRWACTDHETERARHWLPCVDLPQVRCRLDFHLRADADFDILANGRLVDEEEHGDGTKTAHWRLEWPCPSYITCFALGEFTALEDGELRGLPIAYYASSQCTPDHLIAHLRAHWRDALLADGEARSSPSRSRSIISSRCRGIGGAMENISLVSWDEIFVLDESWPRSGDVARRPDQHPRDGAQLLWGRHRLSGLRPRVAQGVVGDLYRDLLAGAQVWRRRAALRLLPQPRGVLRRGG